MNKMSLKRALIPLLALTTMPAFAAPQAQLLLPLGRTVYQTNELIDLSVVRSDTAALPAGMLTRI